MPCQTIAKVNDIIHLALGTSCAYKYTMRVINKTTFKKSLIIEILRLAQVPLRNKCKTLTIAFDETMQDMGVFRHDISGHYDIILKTDSITILAHELAHLSQCERLGERDFHRLYNSEQSYESNKYEIEADNFARLIKIMGYTSK